MDAGADFKKHADELRELWQGRALMETRFHPFGMVVLSVIAHSYDEGMSVLLRAVFPGFTSIKAPFICSTAKIDKTGEIIADMIFPDDPFVHRDQVLFKSIIHLRDAFRRLADALKLPDSERLEMAAVVRAWCNADRRLDPNMDPADPDAKRLVH